MRLSRRTPLLRGFAGASIATFAALLSHVWVSGDVPGVLGIAVPWVLSMMICTLLAGRRLSLTRLSIAVAASQALFHTLFVLGSFTPTGGFTPHVHNPALSLPASTLVPQDAGMWIAHGIAAAITVLFLHRSERIVQGLGALASAVRAWLTRAVLPMPAIPVIAVRRWSVHIAPLRRDPLLDTVLRRGPPLLGI